MAGKVLNIKVCSPLKLHIGLTGKCHAICHYSYNLPLAASLKQDPIIEKMDKTYKYIVKKPSDCMLSEIDKFHELVLEGGKVQELGLKERIKNCVILGFCSYNGKVIGISSIKRPLKSYTQKIINKANLDRHWNDLEFEIGYSFTKENFRRKGISTELKTSLIEQMKEIGGKLFSTTAIASSQKFLEANGFIQIGNSYDGDNDKGLKYYELIIKK